MANGLPLTEVAMRRRRRRRNHAAASAECIRGDGGVTVNVDGPGSVGLGRQREPGQADLGQRGPKEAW